LYHLTHLTTYLWSNAWNPPLSTEETNVIHTGHIIVIVIVHRNCSLQVLRALQFRRLRDRLTRQLTETLGDDGILLVPSWPTTAPFHHQLVFTFFNTAYTCLFNALTLPVIQCPMGLDSKGLPLGIQVVGAHYSDRLLIAAAQQLSQAFGGWTPAWSQ
ncbi:hypothetical protein ANCDUO_26576, partial [Ancylostoma duodenale]